MGTDIHVHVYRKDKYDNYEELKLYRNVDGEMKLCYLPFEDRDYELFDKLTDIVELRGVWPHLDTEDMNDTYNHTWFDWCELNALADTPRAMVKEWMENENGDEVEVKEYNILAPWVAKIEYLLDCYNVYFPVPGEITVCISFDN